MAEFLISSPPGTQAAHKNGDPLDNRRTNLIATTRQRMQVNTVFRLPSKNSSGHRGVSLDKGKGKWMAYLQCDGVLHRGGYFDRLEDAVEARARLEEKYFKALLY